MRSILNRHLRRDKGSQTCGLPKQPGKEPLGAYHSSTANSQLSVPIRYGEVVFATGRWCSLRGGGVRYGEVVLLSVAGAESPPLPEPPASGPLQPKRGRIQAAETMAMKKA
jgi:hypothetical protein